MDNETENNKKKAVLVCVSFYKSICKTVIALHSYFNPILFAMC